MVQLSRRTILTGGSALATGVLIAGETRAALQTDKLAAAIDRAASEAIAANACPGVAAAVWRGGEALFSKDYGTANLETDTPVAARSVFRIGSLTKQFTAAAIIKLSVEGKLGLDDPVSKHLEFFSTLKMVSIRELLNHTAGLHSDEAGPMCLDEKPKTQIDLARAIAEQKQPFDFAPGSAWLYSNTNYIVLGAIIEKVADAPLSAAMQTLVFAPLDLNNTAFDDSTTIVPGRVSGYTPAEVAGVFTRAAYIPIEQAGGAGAMRSTSGDLCRWHAHLFNERLFNAKNVQLMMTPGRLRDGRLASENRFSPQDASYGPTQYGFGLLIPPPTKGHRSVMHYGFINGFAALLETYVDLKLTLAVLCNADVNPALPIRSIRRIVIDQLL